MFGVIVVNFFQGVRQRADAKKMGFSFYTSALCNTRGRNTGPAFKKS